MLPKKRRTETTKKRLSIVLLSATVFLSVMAVIFLVYVKNNIEFEADIELYRNQKYDNITTFYYFPDGKEEIESAKEIEGSAIYDAEKHLYATYDTIPKDLINAFVAIEDKRFYEHNGVDWYRTLGATLNYIFNFRDSFGASTITQQLVKNVTGNDEYKIERKLQEIFSAISLEKQMNKNEILELYLNVINLSQGCRGVRAGAETFFSKELSELTLTECVCLAAITNSPTYYDPYINPENNKARRQVIFEQMLAQGYIDQKTFDECYDENIVLNMSDDYMPEKINSWYIDMVIDDVCKDLCEKYGYSASEASSMVWGGGLKIYTLQSPKIQAILENYYSEETNFFDSGAGITAQSSMIIMDPYGNILGVVGARGKKSANRIQNYATNTKRPSGSVIKPLSVYAPAFEDGIITYSSVFDDVPISFGEYNLDSAKGDIVLPSPWPNNANMIYHGLVNVNYSVEESLNTVPIKILELIGKERSFYFLKETLGCDSLIESMTLENGACLTDIDTAALALGQMNYGVTLREITAAYTMLANEGVYSSPRSYSIVTDSQGKVILNNEASETRAISAENSVIMTEILKNVVDNGTVNDTISLDEIVEVAGKTGTSQDYYDRWFVGYTPYFIGGVWYGYEYPKSLGTSTKYVCTDTWDDIMAEVHDLISENDKKEFATSTNVITVEYCKDSGKIATSACLKDPRGDRCEVGYFVKGTEPTDKCDCHILVAYDSVTKCIACPSCPKMNITYIGMIQVERSFPIQIYVKDAQYVWRDLPSYILPGNSNDVPFFINILPEGSYCGISYSEKQFNCSCKEHFNYLDWILGRKMHN